MQTPATPPTFINIDVSLPPSTLLSFPHIASKHIEPAKMASVLHPPHPHSFPSRSPTAGGILLNPSPLRPLSTLPQSSSYVSRSNQSLSSSASSSEDVNTPSSSFHTTPPPSLGLSLSPPYTSDEDHIRRSRSDSGPEHSATGSRRIRFAPLPDPRRAVCVTEHGEELPLPSVFDDDDANGVPDPNLRNFSTSPSSSLLLGDGVVTPKEVPTVVTPVQASFGQAVGASEPSLPSQARAAESPTHLNVPFTSTSSSTRLAKRLFHPFRQKTDGSRRSGSRDSSLSPDESPSWGAPLHSSAVRSATTAQPKRMLNGRVYGAKKHHHSTSAFKNIPDAEPEFVEWGFGGMGSVHAGGMWSKVQSDKKLFNAEERGRRGAPQSSADDDDDGSGMHWVRKRREERERKKPKTHAGLPPALHSTPVSVPMTIHSSNIVPVDHEISTVMPTQPRHEVDDESSDESEEEEEEDDESSSTDDDDDQEQHSKQVLGAGVERVSRHCD
ncbi:hypothetical protein F5148DRAFT_1171826 [Russula earlei]|uniref:Uncharacterized protein n=1 Tax=Russula earlei TaxID=71964 RepID=A0ACC0UIG9_9AGAM|nr:hypothetical protein F5148DRAFT_1171826 [Russula earlei]